MQNPRCKLNIALFLIIVAGLIACAGPVISPQTNVQGQQESPDPHTPASEFPTALPVDTILPWDEVNDAGFVTPGRGVLAVNGNSELLPGVEREAEGGSVVDNGEASRITSGDAGSGEVSYAIYRMPLGGEQPGVVTVDANLNRKSDSSPSSYFVGLANYTRGSWEWNGPYSDSHARISVGNEVREGTDFLSSLGSVFVAVVVHDGSSVDVVSVGINIFDELDIIAPPVPAGLVATPRTGALELVWNNVIAGDLAGYRVYHRGSAFSLPISVGLKTENISGRPSVLLPVDETTYIRVSAIDISGNESALSEMVSASPLAGEAPEVWMTVDFPSTLISAENVMHAFGAETFDWDLDGDGVFDVTGDATGMQVADTSQAGVIRPLVRGSSNGGSSVALSAVSVIVNVNSRPVVQGYSDIASGVAPLTVLFTSTQADADGSIVERIWDFKGDHTVNWRFSTAGGDENPPAYVFNDPGVYNAKVRVWDESGAWDVDTLTIVVTGNVAPVARFYCVPPIVSVGETIFMYGDASEDPDGSIVVHAWDTDGDGTFDLGTGTNPVTSTFFNTGGYYELKLRVMDDSGETDIAVFTVTVGDDWVNSPDPDNTVRAGSHNSMQIVNGRPAIAYYDDTNFDLRYVRAADENGSEWDSPVVAVATADVEGQYASMMVVNGRPAVAYYNGTQGKLYYVRANDVDGNTWGAPLLVDNNALSGYWNSMQIVDGRPAIAYYNQTTDDLYYARAADADGGGPWTVWLLDNTADVGKYCSLAVINGLPSISYWNETDTDLWFAYSSTADGEGAVWSKLAVIADANENGEYSSLLEVNGRPAISFHHGAPGVDLVYIRADNSNGSSWPAAYTEVNVGGDSGRFTSLTLINGYPAIGFHWMHNTAAAYIRAGDVNGDTWDVSASIYDARGNSGQYANLIQVNGQAAMSYFYIDGADQWLRYARWY